MSGALPHSSGPGERTRGKRAATADWSALNRRLTGEVLLPASRQYSDATRPFNGRYQGKQPVAVVRCATVNDVARTLALARAANLPVAVRSGGHCFAGHSSTHGVVIDTSPLAAIAVRGRRVTVGAGVRLGQLYEQLALHGLTLPGGTCPTVGITGLTLGGGLGILGRQYGLTCDRLVQAEVVLADGTVMTCDPDDHADLFWALRGGGTAGLVVVTSLTFDPVDVPDRAFNMHVSWPLTAALDVVDAWQRWAPSAPDGLAASLKVTVPAALTEDVRVDVYVTWFGSPAEGNQLLEQLTGPLATDSCVPIQVDLQPSDYGGVRDFWANLGQTPSHADKAAAPDGPTGGQDSPDAHEPELLYAASQFFQHPIPPQTIEDLLHVLTTNRHPGEARELDFMPWSGGYARVRPADTAFVHRDDAFLLKQSVSLPLHSSAPVQAAASQHLGQLRAVISHQGTGRAFQNFADPDLADWPQAYYGQNLPRLLRIKSHYDPEDVFHHAQSLPPTTPR